jgi:hypothetical protein
MVRYVLFNINPKESTEIAMMILDRKSELNEDVMNSLGIQELVRQTMMTKGTRLPSEKALEHFANIL